MRLQTKQLRHGPVGDSVGERLAESSHSEDEYHMARKYRVSKHVERARFMLIVFADGLLWVKSQQQSSCSKLINLSRKCVFS